MMLQCHKKSFGSELQHRVDVRQYSKPSLIVLSWSPGGVSVKDAEEFLKNLKAAIKHSKTLK